MPIASRWSAQAVSVSRSEPRRRCDRAHRSCRADRPRTAPPATRSRSASRRSGPWAPDGSPPDRGHPVPAHAGVEVGDLQHEVRDAGEQRRVGFGHSPNIGFYGAAHERPAAQTCIPDRFPMARSSGRHRTARPIQRGPVAGSPAVLPNVARHHRATVCSTSSYGGDEPAGRDDAATRRRTRARRARRINSRARTQRRLRRRTKPATALLTAHSRLPVNSHQAWADAATLRSR